MSVRVLAIVERAGTCSMSELRHQLAKRDAVQVVAVGDLVDGGYLVYVGDGCLRLTPAGLAALDAPPAPAQGDRRNGTRTASSDVQARHQAQL